MALAAGSERYQVVVHVDAAALADPEQRGQSALEDGLHVQLGERRPDPAGQPGAALPAAPPGDLGWAIGILHPAAHPGAYRPAGPSP